MTEFLGFATLEEAKKFSKSHGGIITYDKRNKRTGEPTGVGYYYYCAVVLGGLDKNKYPYCVQWSVK